MDSKVMRCSSERWFSIGVVGGDLMIPPYP